VAETVLPARWDAVIVETLKNRFGNTHQLHAGVVSLTGEVPNIKTSAQASWTAWKVAGVKSVKNDLTVKEKG
jgi:osmotically-inducible protein OsmY